jgi:GTP-binding protein
LENDPQMSPETYHEYLNKILPGLWFCPIVCTSALTGENIWSLISVAKEVQAQAQKKVTTGQLNRALQEAFQKRRPSRVKGRFFKIYYGTQSDTEPPTFLVFCNTPGMVEDQYTRYLAGQLRDAFDMNEIPLKIEYRSSHKDRQR